MELNEKLHMVAAVAELISAQMRHVLKQPLNIGTASGYFQNEVFRIFIPCGNDEYIDVILHTKLDYDVVLPGPAENQWKLHLILEESCHEPYGPLGASVELGKRTLCGCPTFFNAQAIAYAILAILSERASTWAWIYSYVGGFQNV